MTGVSYMIPFVVSGGILLALAVMLHGKGAVPDAGLAKDIFTVGLAGFALMIPILAAYIGFSIADRAAIAPSAIAAWIGNQYGAGFIGAIVAGMIGGIVVFYLKKMRVPPAMRSVMPIFVIPIVGTVVAAGSMMWLLAEPVASATASLTIWLKGLQSGSVIVLAIVMGLMVAFDMGGPVNKVAYAFVVLCVGERLFNVAGISSVAVAVPSLGMGLASLVARSQYSDAEREAGKASLIMGSVGITEGAIPFAVGDPLRVIPSIMVGTACGAVTAAVLGVECFAAWGGLIVLPVVTGRVGFVLALVVGSVVTAGMVTFLKSLKRAEASKGSPANDINLKFEQS